MLKKNKSSRQNRAQRNYLFRKLVIQDIKTRYQGSLLGILWSVLVPLLMLAIYTIIFSEVFKAKWDIDTGNKFQFALVLFCGLSAYNLFSEVMGRAPTLVAANQNYVKKVLFPIEIMPVVITISALFNCLISYLILIVAQIVLTGTLHLTTLWAPIIMLPYILFCAGLAYLVSAISVYLKDVTNIISVVITIGMYLSPVFFPLSSVPKRFQFFCLLNPITYTIENMRKVILYGQAPNIVYLSISCAAGLLLLGIGYLVFKRARPGFADLL